jgi:hypothetical protein
MIAKDTKRPFMAALWLVGAIILIAEITKRPSVAALFNIAFLVEPKR